MKTYSILFTAIFVTAFVSSAPAQTIVNQGSQVRGVPVQRVQQFAPQAQNFSNLQQMSKATLDKVEIGATVYDTGAGGIGVRSVFTNSPAQKAGIQSGDFITKANGQPIQSAASFNTMINGMKSGQTVKLTRVKSGKESEVQVQAATMAQIVEASNVPELNIYDKAIMEANQQVAVLKQQIKNTQEDLKDLTDRLAAQESRLGDLKTKAEETRQKVEAQKKSGSAAK